MAAEADIIRYMITGEDGEVIPENATHVSVHPSVSIIREEAFYHHPDIVELMCHDGVLKIEAEAFIRCPRLKRAIMNGVEEVESEAFSNCRALEYVECDKLEIIGEAAFTNCDSMSSFNLPSAKIVLTDAFGGCEELKYVKFGKKLESFEENVFYNCRDLERITIPLKNGLFQHDDIFQLCENLKQVGFEEGAVLQETIDSLLCDTWRNDMVAEIDSINQILPNAYAGHDDIDIDNGYNSSDDGIDDDPGRKTVVIRYGITNVLRKIVHYKSQHRRLLKEAACRLQLTLPHDIVMNKVVPFLMLPHHTFDGEREGEERELEMDSDDDAVDEPHTSRLGDEEEEDANEGIEEIDADDDVMEEAAEDVTGDKERRKRRKTGNDNLDGEAESD